MPPTASSTKETTNYARLCRLLVDVGTQALRDTLDAIHMPANLHLALMGNKATLQSLRNQKIINPTQWGKLFPTIPCSVSSASFDITLLMVLLRNICGLLPPASGWDNLPVVTDVSREADIARVKYFRNTVYAHAEHASVDNANFNNYWKEIRDAMVRLGGVLYSPAIDHLETECMDPDTEDHYKEVLSQWKKDEDNVKDQLNDIESKISNIEKKLDDLTASNLITTKKDISVDGKSLVELGDMLETSSICSDKHNEPPDCYCQECKVCICNKCGETRHTYHTKMDIKQAAEKQKLKIGEVVEQLNTEICEHEMQMVKMTEMLKNSEGKIFEARNNVRTAVEELFQVLKEREMAMLTQLDVIEEAEQRCHATQMEHSQKFVTQLKNYVENCKAILQRNVGVEILQAQQVAMIKRCKGLLNAKKMTIYKPSFARYERNEDYFQNVSRGAIPGRIVATYTDPLESEAQGDGLKEAEVGREAKFTITTRDSERKQCYDKYDKITVKVQAVSGKDLNTKFEYTADNEEGGYSVTYTPDCVERLDITVAVNGQPLTGSPWSIHDVSPHQYQSVFWFGSPGQQQGQFCTPGGIAINDNTGNIAVADHGNNRIQLFSSDGNFLRAFCQGSGAQRLSNPISVAFNKSNDVIIIDSMKMVCFNESGHFIKNISNKQLYKPRDLTITGDGHMVVCDIGDNAVKVLTPDGSEIVKSFSAPDSPDVPPWSALYHQDKFFVCYGGAHCIKVFNEDGKFLSDIGSQGSGEGQLLFPIGHTIDKFNNLIVCDSRNRRLQVFTLDGKFLNTICGDLTGFQVPWSVAVSSTGQLHITNAQKQCVHVFQ